MKQLDTICRDEYSKNIHKYEPYSKQASNGLYIGYLSGSSIVVVFNNKEYKLTSKHSIRGTSHILVVLDDDEGAEMTYEYLSN